MKANKAMHRLMGLALASCAMVPATTHAQIAPDAYREYGGRYAIDCAIPTSARVIVTSTALMVEQGSKRMSSRNLQASASYFGNSSPPGFVVALQSEAGRGLDLIGFVYADRTGRYLKLDGAPRVRQALGGLVNSRFSDCDMQRNDRAMGNRARVIAGERRGPPPPPIGPPAYVGNAPPPPGVSGNFQRSYKQALGPLASNQWLISWDGPSDEDQPMRIGSVDYVLKTLCKPHDCYDNNMVALYAPSQNVVYGKVLIALRPRFFGGPPPALQQELDRLWRAKFRSR